MKRVLVGFSEAACFQVSQLCVSEWISHWEVPSSGLNMEAMSVIWVSASCVHRCGFLQFISWSLMQSMHVHVRHGMCGPLCPGCALTEAFTRPATVVILCIFIRHFDEVLVSGQGLDLALYQAGSLALMSEAMHSATRLVLYLFAVVTILVMSLLR